MSWFELAHGPFRDFGVSERVIQYESEKRSYGRYPALKKPPLSEEVKRKRREWAEPHEHWTVEDWMAILWTDETWATDGQHKRDWVRRKVGIFVPQLIKNTNLTLSSRWVKKSTPLA